MLEQILAQPDDDDLRMVYADQLLARGDARGEYIALELQLAANVRRSDERTAQLQRRARLRHAHAARWWPGLEDWQIQTRRGFVEAVSVTVAQLRDLAPLAAREPFTTLELLDTCTTPPADEPWHGRIRRMVVHAGNGDELLPLWDGALGRAIAELVLGSPPSIREDCPYGSCVPQLSELADRLPACRSLCLSGMPLEGYYTAEVQNDGPLQVLAAWRHLESLEALDLSYCNVGRELAVLSLPSLRVLKLSGNRIQHQASALAARLPSLPALERLELRDQPLGEDVLASLRARTRAQLIIDEPRPDRIALDLAGRELELVRLEGSRWAIYLDGTRQVIRRVRQVPRSPSVDEVAEHAELESLARALYAGARYCYRPPDVMVKTGPSFGVAFELIPGRREIRYRRYWEHRPTYP